MGVFTQLFQRRSQRSYAPPEGMLAGLGGAMATSGVRVTEKSSREYSAVMAATRVLSESVAMLPFVLYRRLADGRERAVGHRLYEVLHDQPNPEIDSFAFWDLCVTHLVLWGNFFAEMEINGRGEVLALWPLHPGRMQVGLDGGRRVYQYHVPGEGMKDLSTDRVFHVMGVAKNGVVGMSLLSAARNAIGLGLAAEEYGAKLFANGAKPPLVLEYPGRLKPEARENLRKSWEETHGGLSNAHRVAVLEEGLTAKVIGIPPDDAQFLETRKFQVTEIARIFRVPPHFLADLDRATFSNIEQQSLEFVVYSLGPWLTRIERAVRTQLLTRPERKVYFAEFLVAGLLRGDIQTRYQAYAVGRQWGWLSRNDVRRLENMNPIPGGDDYLTPLNMMALGQDEALDAQREEAPDGGGQRAEGGDQRSEVRGRRSEGGEQRAVEGRPRAAVARHRLAGAFAPTMRDVVQRIVNREVNDVRNAARRLLKNGPSPDWALWLRDFYSRENHGAFVREYLAAPFASYGELILDYVADEVGERPDSGQAERFTADYLAIQADVWCKRHRIALEEATSNQDDDALARVEAALTEGKEGWADDFVSEHAYRFNNALALAAYGWLSITRKIWVAFGDSCPYCTSLSGVTVELDMTFVSDGEALDVGGDHPVFHSHHNVGHPPLHRGCDCMVISA